MSDQPAYYHFISWARSGMATLITAPMWGKDGPVPAEATSRVELQVALRLTGQINDEDVNLKDGDKPHLYGPGDVIGIDQREIIRTSPLPLTPDYAPEKFALIEFDRPDFPWMFTPAAQKEDCLRPWIVLVVVEKSKATITPPTANALPVLTCPVRELPPSLEESWAWAHAQYAGDFGATVREELSHAASQDLNLSRLLCPRRLAPHTPYVACLVPAFEAGRKAGLGMAFNPDNERLVHWTFTKDEEVKLPVYYQWEFSTGQADPFRELAEKLQPLTPDEMKSAQSGIIRDMDLSHPENGMGTYTNAKAPIPSALRIKGVSTIPGTIPAQFTTTLTQLLTAEKEAPIPPPVYGSWHAQPGEIAQQLADLQGWLSMLNLNPSYRVAAALGTQIIQQEQDHWVAMAWEQVKDLQAANELIVRKQLGCCVTDAIHGNRLATLSLPVFAQVFSQIAPSVWLAARDKAAQAAGPSNAPPSGLVVKTASAGPGKDTLQDATTSPQFRRMTRGGGPWAMTGSMSGYDPDHIAPPPGATEGAKQVSGYRPTQTGNQKTASGFATAADADTAERLKRELLQQGLLEVTKPQQTFAQDVGNRVVLAEPTRLKKDAPHDGPAEGGCQQCGPLGLVTYAPSFSQPMYGSLRDQFPDMLLPGLDKIPNDRVAFLDPDAKFIEAYLVGLNHELSREFLWREFPTLLHTTYFQQFWDARGAKNPTQRDISPLREWGKSLGENLAKDRGGKLRFLLIRGELMMRFPNVLIHARNASTIIYPVLRISPIAGVTLLGFDIPTNSDDWNFFAEQHLTEPFFGPKGKAPKAEAPDTNPYISFPQAKENDGLLYLNTRNSAEIAADILSQHRYMIKIKAPKFSATQ